jgi:octanoyl-[GcvH]:protein N-octanoyltransferase
VRLLRDSFPERPALDIAVSHALLTRVADGELDATLRLYRPGPTLAFGRLDALRPGFRRAGAAAREHGFEPLVRLAGGHAAAYHEDSLIYEEITPQPDVTAGLHERFRDGAALLAGALDGLGVDARVGEIPGEYCAGAYTVSASGRLKLVGVAQRAVRGAALLTAFVLVAGGDRLRAALVDVYRELELEWDPRTAGALDDVLPGASMVAVEQALLSARAHDRELTVAAIDDPTLELAHELEARHRWEDRP